MPLTNQTSKEKFKSSFKLFFFFSALGLIASIKNGKQNTLQENIYIVVFMKPALK